MSEEEILAAPYLNYPLTKFMYCAPDEGAGAVVLCRRDLASKYSDSPVHLAAAELRTRRSGAFEVSSPSLPAVAVAESDGVRLDRGVREGGDRS